MSEKDIKLGYDDVMVIPDEITYIDSRAECNTFDEDGYLPIFASCMDTVVSKENADEFRAAKIRPVIPRTYGLAERVRWCCCDEKAVGMFVSFSLSEARDVFIDKKPLGWKKELAGDLMVDRPVTVSEDNIYYICIDIANGHMKQLFDTIKELKDLYGEKMVIMAGNLANPKTYKYYEKAGCDYVRCGVGTGGFCITASNTSIFYPPFSLIKETYEEKKRLGGKCKIIADGGIKGFRDIQKALVYADYVMIGTLFNKTIESAGKTTYGRSYWKVFGLKIINPFLTLLRYGREVKGLNDFNTFKRDEVITKFSKKIKNGTLDIWKVGYGMASKEAQKEILKGNPKVNAKIKTAEGVVKRQKVEYDLFGWAENEEDFLRSAMSYTNSKTLEDYKESPWVRVSKRDYNN